MKMMKRVRKSFAKIGEAIEKPHLIEMQQLSYEKFLQIDVDPDDRADIGLQGIFKNIFLHLPMELGTLGSIINRNGVVCTFQVYL